MKSDIKQFVEVLGGIAILVSIILVYSELRQSNRIATATAEAELRSAQREVNMLRAENPELAAILLKAQDASAQLSPVEDVLLEGYAAAQFSVFTQTNASEVNGLLTPYTVNVYALQIPSMLEIYPQMARHWAAIARRADLRPGISIMWDTLLDTLAELGYEV